MKKKPDLYHRTKGGVKTGVKKGHKTAAFKANVEALKNKLGTVRKLSSKRLSPESKAKRILNIKKMREPGYDENVQYVAVTEQKVGDAYKEIRSVKFADKPQADRYAIRQRESLKEVGPFKVTVKRVSSPVQLKGAMSSGNIVEGDIML